eukprot:GEZU01000435.1.p1 GENE.GEZU01000435.1~~GEZU01000435.1.p1  ORF type:complete len:524 (-),score=216.05 GEZU01000435.1:1343-2893(-)
MPYHHHNNSAIPLFQPILTITEGFATAPLQKQPGGKDNMKKIQKHVIELNVNSLPSGHDPANLKVKASVLGYDRLSRSKMVLDECYAVNLKEVSSVGGMTKRWIAEFDKIVVKRTSHNNGGKLFLRFTLVDTTNDIETKIAHVDSAEFETITKRGLEKKRERDRGSVEQEAIPIAMAVEPPVGVIYGRQYVKVVGQSFVPSPVSQLIVKFGDATSPEVFTVKRNFILCETPAAEREGQVEVSVSFDAGKSFIESEAKYLYVNPATADGQQQLLTYGFFRGPQNSNHHHQQQQHNQYPHNGGGGARSPQQQSPPMGYNKRTDFSNMLEGGRDACGFNMLAYTSTLGQYELTAQLLKKGFGGNVNDLDNFGRTPLFWAFAGGNSQIVKLLLSKGASLLHKDEVQDNVFHVAVENNKVDAIRQVAQWLLDNDDTFTNKNAEAILALINGANVNGITPLALAQKLYSSSSSSNANTIPSNNVCSTSSRYKCTHTNSIRSSLIHTSRPWLQPTTTSAAAPM